MTAEEFEKAARDRFQAAGLTPDFDADESQFLELPDGLFVEIVVRDGTKLQEVRRIVGELSSKVGEKVDAIVRAEWELENVGDPQPAYAVGGGLRAAEIYPVILKAGAARQQVWVEVTLLAKMSLRDNGIEGAEVKKVVDEFVKEQLQLGGASYWDPIQFPQLEITGGMVPFMVGRLLQKRMAKRPAV